MRWRDRGGEKGRWHGERGREEEERAVGAKGVGLVSIPEGYRGSERHKQSGVRRW